MPLYNAAPWMIRHTGLKYQHTGWDKDREDAQGLRDHDCNLQNGSCHPAIGKCILKGKAVRAKDIQNSENTITIPGSE